MSDHHMWIRLQRGDRVVDCGICLSLIPQAVRLVHELRPAGIGCEHCMAGLYDLLDLYMRDTAPDPSGDRMNKTVAVALWLVQALQPEFLASLDGILIVLVTMPVGARAIVRPSGSASAPAELHIEFVMATADRSMPSGSTQETRHAIGPFVLATAASPKEMIQSAIVAALGRLSADRRSRHARRRGRCIRPPRGRSRSRGAVWSRGPGLPGVGPACPRG